MSDIEMIKIIKSLYFLFNLFFIFSFEFVFYVFFLDYYNFIERITTKLASINILYVKLFQAIALNNSIIDDKLNNKLLEFTDHAPWTNNDIQFYDLIEMTDKYNIILDNNFEQPSNSGMISLIFKGYIKKENKKVIIKLKRRNIENKLNEAIQGLTFLMYLLSFIPIINKYKITEVVNKNIEIILQQTNFHKEVENILRVQNNCKNLKYVTLVTLNLAY
jgi:predicted unusual protein kinase regulating ubiquinone biosynthesis (AarF/ABC1/UbiB family)